MEVEVEAGPVEEEGAEADVASDRVLDSTSETFGIRSIESNPTPTPTPTPTPNPYPNPSPNPSPNPNPNQALQKGVPGIFSTRNGAYFQAAH